jgi:hypothetical protein
MSAQMDGPWAIRTGRGHENLDVDGASKIIQDLPSGPAQPRLSRAHHDDILNQGTELVAGGDPEIPNAIVLRVGAPTKDGQSRSPVDGMPLGSPVGCLQVHNFNCDLVGKGGDFIKDVARIGARGAFVGDGQKKCHRRLDPLEHVYQSSPVLI